MNYKQKRFSEFQEILTVERNKFKKFYQKDNRTQDDVPAEIMAKEIPDVRHVIIPGIGHMTAIEDPEGFTREILDFLETVKQTGKANR